MSIERMQDHRDYRPPQLSYICVVHKDDDLLVISKPGGLLSVPGKGPDRADCMEIRAGTAYPGAVITHRLDMDTSGLLVLARHKNAQRHISRQFEQRSIKKIYIARIWGQVKKQGGIIDLPLICDWPNRPLQKVCFTYGKPAKTEWTLLKQDEDSALVELRPVTGRSHQLRVHMKELGHPVLGDAFYAHDAAQRACSRLALHARAITLEHPRTGALCTFCDAHPFPDFRSFSPAAA